jgi:hypothetical protein
MTFAKLKPFAGASPRTSRLGRTTAKEPIDALRQKRANKEQCKKTEHWPSVRLDVPEHV